MTIHNRSKILPVQALCFDTQPHEMCKCGCVELQIMQITMSHLNIVKFLFGRQRVSAAHLHLLLEASQGREIGNAICGDAPEHLHHISALSNPCM